MAGRGEYDREPKKTTKKKTNKKDNLVSQVFSMSFNITKTKIIFLTCWRRAAKGLENGIGENHKLRSLHYRHFGTKFSTPPCLTCSLPRPPGLPQTLRQMDRAKGGESNEPRGESSRVVRR